MDERLKITALDVLSWNSVEHLMNPEIVAAIIGQRGWISMLQQRIWILISLGWMQEALTSWNITAIQECLESFTKWDPDIILQEKIYAMTLESVKIIFLEIKQEGAKKTDLAKCLNKALSIFPRNSSQDWSHTFLNEINKISYEIICFFMEKIWQLRKTKSSDLEFYNISYYIIYHCMVSMDQVTAQSINTSINRKYLKVSKKDNEDFYNWCVDIGFDEHHCHDIHFAIHRRWTINDDKRIKRARKREKNRQEKILQRNKRDVQEKETEEIFF